jgi:hypothetical protein
VESEEVRMVSDLFVTASTGEDPRTNLSSYASDFTGAERGTEPGSSSSEPWSIAEEDYTMV